MEKKHLIPCCLKEETVVDDKIAYFIFELQQKAAIVIQSVWRGYVLRKNFKSSKLDLKRNRAAVIIQRAVREWLYRKHELMKLKNETHGLEVITEEKLKLLQKEIKEWCDSHPKQKFEGMAQFEETHKEVQNKLHQFYIRASTKKAREQHIETKCAQIEAVTALLKDSPTLNDSVDSDLSFYRCLPVEHAALARMKHKHQLKLQNSLWWKNLNFEDDVT